MDKLIAAFPKNIEEALLIAEKANSGKYHQKCCHLWNGRFRYRRTFGIILGSK